MAVDDIYQAWVALRQTVLTLERALDARLLPWRLGQSQAMVLLVLARHGPQRISDLGHVLVRSLQATGSLVDRLEQPGLVQRQHGHATDRRIVLVALTDAGHALANDISIPAWSTIAKSFAGLSDADLAAVTAMLRRVRAVGPLSRLSGPSI